MLNHCRFLSTLNYSVPLATNATAVSKDECREFMSVFPGMQMSHLYFVRRFNVISFRRFGTRFDGKSQKIRLQRCIEMVGSGEF